MQFQYTENDIENVVLKSFLDLLEWMSITINKLSLLISHENSYPETI